MTDQFCSKIDVNDLLTWVTDGKMVASFASYFGTKGKRVLGIDGRGKFIVKVNDRLVYNGKNWIEAANAYNTAFN